MNIFELNNKNDSDEVIKIENFKEFAINFETGEPLIIENDIVELEKNEALKVWIYKVLKTKLNKYEIHSENYGNDLDEHIGTIYSKEIKEALITEEIRTTILVNPCITSVYNFEFNYDYDTSILNVKFTVTTIYGNFDFGGEIL